MNRWRMFAGGWGLLLAFLVLVFMTTPAFTAPKTNIDKDEAVIHSQKAKVNFPQKAVKGEKPASVKAPEALDVERINQIRLERDQARGRLERSKARLQRQQLAKLKEQIRSWSFLRDRREIPHFANPFQWERESSRQGGAPVIMGRRGSRSTNDLIDVQVNGADADTVTQGDTLVFTVYFSTGYTEADIRIWIDMDGDGVLNDTVDFDVGDVDHIVDNDEYDEHPADGVYQFTIYGDDEEGPQRVSNLGFFVEAIDGGGSDAAFVFIEPMDTDYSVSGAVTPPMANIMVFAIPYDEWGDDRQDDVMPWMTVTDASGLYQNFLPDTGTYAIFSFDFLGVTEGMFADTAYFDVFVYGHLTGFDFNYIAPTAWIEGTVANEYGNPLAGIEVRAKPAEDGPGGPGFDLYTETDEYGYYSLGVIEGEWWVGLEHEDLIPGFLVPHGEMRYVADGATEIVDFTVYSTDAIISGMVFYDDVPAGGYRVGAGSHLGWTEAESGPDGYYELHVSSMADDEGGYRVNLHEWFDDAYVVEHYDGIPSGSGYIDFHIYTAPAAIEGHVYDSQTGEPLEYNAWVGAWDGMDGWYGTGTREDGYYRLPLPNGIYEVNAGADGYYGQMVSNVLVQDNVIPMDFWLDPLSLDGSLSGYVYDTEDNPLEGADVSVGSEFYGDHTTTDEFGYYHFDLPYGIYWADAWMEGYAGDHVDEIQVIQENPNPTHDFHLQPITIEGAIEGLVFDAETDNPIIGAHVQAWCDFYWTETWTGADGYFFLEVPSDSFEVDAWAPGYNPEWREVFVAVGDTAWLDIGLWPQMIQPPFIHSVRDVPHDQGRQVRIAWWSGNPDYYGDWTFFSIWRFVNGSQPPLWDFIATVPFHGIEDYAYVAPTLVDSNAQTWPTGECWFEFRVTAHTHNPWEFEDSEPMDGYSVDNLRPGVPGGLTASVDENNIVLGWLPNTEEDLNYYAVYRGLIPDFEPGETYDFTIDTSYVDGAVDPGVTYYYRVTATDFNGNQSDYSEEVNATLLGVDGGVVELPTRYELAQNFPNPFNPITTIRYALPMESEVSLIIYDVLGQRVRTLVSGSQGVGYYNAVWDGRDDAGMAVASGVYIYRLTAGEFTQVHKMILMK